MKTLLAVTLGMLLASCALAQSTASAPYPPPRNELFAGVGDPGVIWMFWDTAVDIFEGGSVTHGDEQGGFQIFAGYQRRFGSWASAGFTTSWAGTRRTTFYRGVESGKEEIQILTWMADGRAHWLRRPNAELYSGLSLGVTLISDKFASLPIDGDTWVGPGLQLMPIGIRLGRRTGGFFETGIGTNGFVKAGISHRL